MLLQRGRHEYAAMLNAAIHGELDDVPMEKDPVFQVSIPKHCPGVPDEVLQPASAWQDADAYQLKARELAKLFQDNFRHIAEEAGPEVSNAGPVLS